MITRSTDALLKKKNKKRLILDVDSTEDPAHGNQDQMAYNGHFGNKTSTGQCAFSQWNSRSHQAHRHQV
jgi:hypothetical protein